MNSLRRSAVVLIIVLIITATLLDAAHYISSHGDLDISIQEVEDGLMQYLYRDNGDLVTRDERGDLATARMKTILGGENYTWTQQQALLSSLSITDLYSRLYLEPEMTMAEESLRIDGLSEERFGWNLTLGDINDSGNHDLVVGAPYQAGESLSIFDDFQDGDHTSNPTWTEHSGSWTVEDDEGLYWLAGSGRISTPSTQAYGRWEWDFQFSTISGEQRMGFYMIQSEADPTSGDQDGYYVNLTSGGEVLLYRLDDGSTTLRISGSWTPNTDWNTLAVERTIDGYFVVFLEDDVIGVVRDNDHTGSDYIGFNHDGTHRVGEIRTMANTNTQFAEGFNGVSVGAIPEGWNRTHTNWGVLNENRAGGTGPELRFHYTPTATDVFRCNTPQLDTSDFDELELSFRQFVDHQTDSFTLRVQTSTDGESWTNVWSQVVSADIPAETRNFTLNDTHGVGSETLYIAWTFDGNSNDLTIWGWRIDDIVLTGDVEGVVYAFFGGDDLFVGDELDVSDANVSITGAAGSEFGWSVAANYTDWNGDGIDDLIVGAPGEDKVYVFYGKSDWDSVSSYGDADAVISGPAGSRFGASVTGADLNRDGSYSLVVGAPGYDESKGAVYVFHDNSASLNYGDAASVIIGKFDGDRLGHDVAGIRSVADTTGEWTDLIVGAPFASNGDGERPGRAYIFLGDESFAAGEWDLYQKNADITLVGEGDGDRFGWSVFSAGDLNNDGYGDVIVGAPGYDDNTGRAYIYLGGADMTTGGVPLSAAEIPRETYTRGGLYGKDFCGPIPPDRSGESENRLTGGEDVYIFTTCGATGQFGPTQDDADAEYEGTNLEGKVDVPDDAGIQIWEVPVTGLYNITALGAEGGGQSGYTGLGANMSGHFELEEGQELKILVGQYGLDQNQGYHSSDRGGGGGGTFVTFANNTALIIAGGGGGQGAGTGVTESGRDASTGESGVSGGGDDPGSGGTDGDGGQDAPSAASFEGSGGGGLLGDGADYSGSYTGGDAFINGGVGGSGSASGGFGGGGSSYWGGGGGGGYSGGGGGDDPGGGGGGGSLNNGTEQYNVVDNSGHGEVRIELLETVDVGLIYNWEDLHNITDDLTEDYTLMNDIGPEDHGYDTYVDVANGWLPIGDDTTPFTGSFNGQNYTISGLTIDRSGTDYVGLFGYIGTTGSVTNVSLKDVDVEGQDSVGALAGHNDGTVRYTNVSGEVTGRQLVGGLVGFNDDGTISYSSANITLDANDRSGGLVGRNDGTIEYCFSKGTVTGGTGTTGVRVGGLVGQIWIGGLVTNSYSRADVSAYNSVGGLVGRVEESTVTNSYSTGSIGSEITAPETVGGLVGSVSENSPTITNSFYDETTSGWSDTTKGTPRLTHEMQREVTFTDWDFSDIWSISPRVNDGYPTLSWQAEAEDYAVEPTGSGTEGTPYLIDSLAKLYWITQDTDRWSDHYEQTADIDASETTTWCGGSGWLPIGYVDPVGNRFDGSYDGDNHTISDLFINRPDETEIGVGLFGNIRATGVVKGVGLPNANITGESRVGSIAGRNYGTIKYSYATGEVSGTGNRVGGLVGDQTDGLLEISYARVDVTSSGNSIGGLLGYLDEATVFNTYSTGDVNGNTYVGGIIGYMTGATTLSHSYVIGDATGSSVVGGLVGRTNTAGCTIVDVVRYNVNAVNVAEHDGSIQGRWGLASEEEMKNIRLYTDNDYSSLPNLNEAWNITGVYAKWLNDDGSIWNIVNHFSYPFFGWEVHEEPETEFDLTLQSTVGGSTVPAEDTHTYFEGMYVDIEAIPDDNYVFIEWTGDNSTVVDTKSNVTKIYIAGDYTLQAVFNPETRTLITDSTAGGSVVVPGENTYHYDHGTFVEIEAQPEEGYEFVGWTGDTGTIANTALNETTIEMLGDYSITANFAVIEYELTIDSTAGGEVTDPGEGTFTEIEYGTEVDIEAQPDAGYEFVEWTGDIGTIANTAMNKTTITMFGDYSITANFAVIQYDLTIDSTAGGTVTDPGEGTFTYNENTVVDLEAEPDEGFFFVEWTGDIGTIADPGSNVTTIEMLDDYSITANFAPDDFFKLFYGNATNPDRFGWNITKADIDSSGYNETIISAPYNNSADGSVENVGAVYVFFYSIELNLFPENADVVIYGTIPGGNFGWDLAGVGDSIVVGCPHSQNGSAYYIPGSVILDARGNGGVLDADATGIINITGESEGDKFGASVSYAGVFNGNGDHSFAVGAWNATIAKGGGEAALLGGSTEVLLEEGFEDSVPPDGWSQEHVSGRQPNWEQHEDGRFGNPSSAHTGTYLARLYDTSSSEARVRLITSSIDFSGYYEATLEFWHAQVAWVDGIDELRVFYRTSEEGSWELIDGAEYTTAVPSWTKRTLELPDLSDDYYIAFEGNALYGYGVCIDTVFINATIMDDITAGRAYIFHGDSPPASAADADIILNGTDEGDMFGFSLAGGGDFFGEGGPDLIVGAPGADKVYVYNGTELEGNLYNVSIEGDPDTQFGWSVAFIGDFIGSTNDGIAVGAPGTANGKVYLYYYDDGVELEDEINGENAGDGFGYAIDAGDANEDGTWDLIVGAPFFSQDTGRFYVFEGAESIPASAGDAAQRQSGPGEGNRTGWSVLHLGFIAPDGDPIAVGSPGWYDWQGNVTIYGYYLIDDLGEIFITFKVETHTGGAPLTQENAIKVNIGGQEFWLWDTSEISGTFSKGLSYTYSLYNFNTSLAENRWIRSSDEDPFSGTLTCDLNEATITVRYYEQWYLIFAATTMNAGKQMNDTNYITVTYTANGTGDQTIQIYDGHSIGRWVDNSTGYSYPAISELSDTDNRWYSTAPPSATAIYTSETITGEYYEQWYVTWNTHTEVGTALSDTNFATVNFQSNGSADSVNVWDGNSITRWADNASYEYSRVVGGTSENHRWYNHEWVQGTHIWNTSFTAVYYEQWYVTWNTDTQAGTKLSGDIFATVNFQSNGSADSVDVWDDNPVSRWADNASYEYSRVVEGSSENHRWYNHEWVQGTHIWNTSFTAVYYEQWYVTWNTNTEVGAALSDTNYATVNFQSNGSADSINVWDGNPVTRWADNATYSYSELSEGSEGPRRWYNHPRIEGSHIWNTSFTAVYYEQWEVEFTANDANEVGGMPGVQMNYHQFGEELQEQSYGTYWVDAGSEATYLIYTVDDNHRWAPDEETSGAITSADGKSVDYYRQYRNTLGVQVVSPGNPFPSDLTISFTAFGEADSLVLGNGETTASELVWTDYDTDITWMTVVTNGNTRWWFDPVQTNPQSSTSGGNDWVKDYFQQWSVTFGTNTESGTPLDAGNFVRVTYDWCSQTNMTEVHDEQSSQVWVNHGGNYNFTTTSSDSGETQRWYSDDEIDSDAFSGTITEHHALIECDYYHQHKVTFEAHTIGVNPLNDTNYVRVQYAWGGDTNDTDIIYDGLGRVVWVDHDGEYNYTQTSMGPNGSTATHRWYTNETISANYTGSITGTLTINCTYQDQLSVTFAVTLEVGTGLDDDQNYVNVTYTWSEGSLVIGPIYVGNSQQIWINVGDEFGSYQYTTISNGSDSQVRWYSDINLDSDFAGDIEEAGTITCAYWQQWSVTFGTSTEAGTPLDVGNYVRVTYAWGSGTNLTDHIYDGQSRQVWVDHNGAYNFTTTSSASGETQRWYSDGEIDSDAFSGTITEHHALIECDYYHQHRVTFEAHTIGVNPLNDTNYVRVQYAWGGNTNDTDIIYDGLGRVVWVDHDGEYNYTQTSMGPNGSTATHRWYTNETISANYTGSITGTVNINCTYQEQLSVTFAVTLEVGNGLDDDQNYVNVTYTWSEGSIVIGPIYVGNSQQIWVNVGDEFGSYQYSTVSNGSDSQVRWYSDINLDSDFAGDIEEAGTITCAYWQQWSVTFGTSTEAGTPLDVGNYVRVTYAWGSGTNLTDHIYDGQSRQVWVDHNGAYNFTTTSSDSGGTERWYSDGEIDSDAFSGTITEHHAEIECDYYHQHKVTFEAHTIGVNQMRDGNHTFVTYDWGTAQNQTGAIYDGHSQSVWVNHGGSYSYEETSTGSTASHRWYSDLEIYEDFSGIITVTGSFDCPYQEQLAVVFEVRVEVGDELDSDNYAEVEYEYLEDTITIGPIYYGNPQSVWVNVGDTIEIEYTFLHTTSGSNNQGRWYSDATLCGNFTGFITGPGTFNCTYWQQWSVTFGTSTVGTDLTGGNYVRVTYAWGSQTNHTDEIYDAQSRQVWVDHGGAYNFTSLSSDSSGTRRWYSDGEIDSDFNGTIEEYYESLICTYYEQWYMTFSFNDALETSVSVEIPVSYLNATQPLIINANDVGNSTWVDAGSHYTYTSPLVNGNVRWYSESGNLSAAVTGSVTVEPDYYLQYRIQVSTTGGFLTVTYSTTLHWYNMTAQDDTTIYDGISPMHIWMDWGSTFNVDPDSIPGPSNGRTITYVCDVSSMDVNDVTGYEYAFLFHAEFAADITIDGPEGTHEFGWAVSGGMDSLMDGSNEVMVSAPLWDSSAGIVYLFNGDDGWVVGGDISLGTEDSFKEYEGGAAGDSLGWSIFAGAADMTGDGRPNFAMGAPFRDSDKGSVYVIGIGVEEFPIIVLKYYLNGELIAEGQFDADLGMGWYEHRTTPEEMVTAEAGQRLKIDIGVEGEAYVVLYYGNETHDSRYWVPGDMGLAQTEWVRTLRDDGGWVVTDEWRPTFSEGESIKFNASILSDYPDVIEGARIAIYDERGNLMMNYTDMQESGDNYTYIFDTSQLRYHGRFYALVEAVDTNGNTDAGYGETVSKMAHFRVVA